MSNATEFNQRLINLCRDIQFKYKKKTHKISGNQVWNHEYKFIGSKWLQ